MMKSSKLKFLHLAATDHGGAGTATWRLHDAIRKQGHQSRLLVLSRRTGDPDVIEICKSKYWFRSLRIVIKAMLKVFSKPDYYFQQQGLTPHLPPDYLLHKAGMNPDVIVVHFISHFLSVTDVRALYDATKVPVVWHLLDMSAMTGGCHFAWNCNGYTLQCGNCPALRTARRNDLSARIFAQKRAAMKDMRAIVAAGSSTLAKQARVSTLLGGLPIHVQLQGISPEEFCPRDKLSERKKFGIQGRGPIIFFGAQKFNQRRKGMSLLMRSLVQLKQRWPQDIDSPVILTAGDESDFTEFSRIGWEHRALGFVDIKTLARVYAVADAFACPSIEDSGPMMINEAVMCGTPVVAFDMGVANDLIEHGKTGFIAKLGNIDSFTDGLMEVLSWNPHKMQSAIEESRRIALKKCDPEIQAERFVGIVQELKSISSVEHA